MLATPRRSPSFVDHASVLPDVGHVPDSCPLVAAAWTQYRSLPPALAPYLFSPRLFSLPTAQSFPGTADAINFSSRPVYIITTKQTRFALALLAAAGVSAAKVPPERVFGHGSGSKIATLNKILAMPENAGCHIQFVEDRYETLEGVSLSMLGAPVSLYLADWGYNTERTRKRAERNPLVQVLSLSDFCTKMQ